MAKKVGRIPCVLTVAGSDSGGGAGIQADLKSFTALNVYGASVITALTAQNTQGVQGVHVPETSFIEKQLESVLSDIEVRVVKTGMLPNDSIIKVTSTYIKRYKIATVVVDPVMVATSGDSLTSGQDIRKTMISELFPLATIVTPNIPEAETICEMKIECLDDARAACRKLISLGCRSVLLKGGHSFSSNNKSTNNDNRQRDDATNTNATDLFYDGSNWDVFSAPWIETHNTHGTGCTLASAIAARLAHGDSLKEAVRLAKQFVWWGLNSGLQIGTGNGPLYHMQTVNDFQTGEL